MGAPERGVTIEGTENAVNMAKNEIEQLVEEARSRTSGGGDHRGGGDQRGGNDHRGGGPDYRHPPQRETIHFPVPATKVGLIIGKGVLSSSHA